MNESKGSINASQWRHQTDKTISCISVIFFSPLQEFIMRHTSDPHTEAQDAIFAFLMHQAIELARDCLDKSQEEQISHNYFTQLSEKLRILAEDVSVMYAAKFPLNLSGMAHFQRYFMDTASLGFKGISAMEYLLSYCIVTPNLQ